MNLGLTAARRLVVAALSLGCISLAGCADVAPEARVPAARAEVLTGVVPLTWQNTYFPRFNIVMTEANRALLHAELTETRYPMTLSYQGMSYPGTVRLRLGNNSRCGDKKQFRIDFPSYVTFPDGYRTNRLETDRGNCYTMHEWFSFWMLQRIGARHPELPVMWKRATVAAVSFNDQLYHVQTLTEDVNKDLFERFIDHRNTQSYKNGCYTDVRDPWLQSFCQEYDVDTLATMIDIPSFLFSTAVVMGLGSTDNYPNAGWNWYLVRDLNRGRALTLADDMDLAPTSWGSTDLDPFSVTNPKGDSQRAFTSITFDPRYRPIYRQFLREFASSLDPAVTLPMLSARYEMIRSTLLASPDLPQPRDGWYDFVYREELPQWIRGRRTYLNGLLGVTGAR